MKVGVLFVLIARALSAPYSHLLFLLATAVAVHGQGTFVFDQKSSTDETPWPNGAGVTIQQVIPPYGQSFTPTMPAMDFIRLNLNDPFPFNSVGATLSINLKTSINGSVTASSASVSLQDSFAGAVDFLFPSSVPLTPGQVYYFQPVVQSGDPWNLAVSEFNYSGGSVFFNGQPSLGGDYWFREGLLVPEPSTILLLLLGGSFLLLRRRTRSV